MENNKKRIIIVSDNKKNIYKLNNNYEVINIYYLEGILEQLNKNKNIYIIIIDKKDIREKEEIIYKIHKKNRKIRIIIFSNNIKNRSKYIERYKIINKKDILKIIEEKKIVVIFREKITMKIIKKIENKEKVNLVDINRIENTTIFRMLIILNGKIDLKTRKKIYNSANNIYLYDTNRNNEIKNIKEFFKLQKNINIKNINKNIIKKINKK